MSEGAARAGWPTVAKSCVRVFTMGGGHGRPRTNTRASFGSCLMHMRPKPSVLQPGSAHRISMRTPFCYPSDTMLKHHRAPFLYSMRGR
jgi:hypothetical protein